MKKGIVMADTDPAALEREIERTRANLARTVDAIAERVSPKRVAERGVAKFRSNAEHLVASVSDRVTGNSHRPAEGAAREGEPPPTDLAPLIMGAGAVIAMSAVVVLLRRRERLGVDVFAERQAAFWAM